MGGHGYAVVRSSEKAMETEFVCIARPITRAEQPDGGPLMYRVTHRTEIWQKGKPPRLTLKVLEGDPRFSI